MMIRERSLPSGVQLMAWARTVRYVGWGFGESLIPVLIMSLTGSFAEAGLIRSTYDITLLLALPVIGILAERFPAKWLVVAGLCIYPFVGLGYFLAGATGLLLFIVLARLGNGISWGLDSVGINTYFRRLTPAGSIAASFGFIDTVSNLGWIAAALAGIWLVRYFSVSQLLLLIAPFALIALYIALKARRDHPALGKASRKLPLGTAYRAALDEWLIWGSDLRLLAGLLLFTETVAVLVDFFIPIDIYLKSGNLALVILFGVVITIPPVFGYLLGWVADHREKHRLAALACVLMALVLLVFTFSMPYAFTILAGLALGVLIELLSIVQKSIATKITATEHWGRLDSVFSIVSGVSDLAAPALLGAALDLIGFPALAAILAGVAFFLALVFILNTHGPHAGRATTFLSLVIPPPERSV